MSQKVTSRIASIEVFRVISMFAIVCIHTAPFYSLGVIDARYKMLAYAIMSAFRFAVPFFFLSAGYFIGKSMSKYPDPLSLVQKQIKRLATLFFLWVLLYTLLPRHAVTDSFAVETFFSSGLRNAFEVFKASPMNFLFEGPMDHLWFLPGLICAYGMISVFVRAKIQRYFLAVAFLLYVFSVLVTLYSVTPIGINLPGNFHFRNGPFFSALFVGIGWKLSFLEKPPVSAKMALIILSVGFLIQEVEAFAISMVYHVTPGFDCLFGTIPFGLGFFLFALAKPDFGKETIFLKGAGLVLGIYLVHPYIKMLLKLVASFFNPYLWQILFPILVFLISAAIVYGLKKFNFTKPLVS